MPHSNATTTLALLTCLACVGCLPKSDDIGHDGPGKRPLYEAGAALLDIRSLPP
jgi:hypothetical protein